ncbi:hypothetical protein P692DRAFT_20339252 [Suillus brevipes Sb2]|nr:hypothetical protein P692DRAFT_20339252 [Suillus brevipes Sb2]
MYFVTYTCGCNRISRFVQCQTRQGTNIRCSPYTRTLEGYSGNYCAQHLVKPTAPSPMNK